MIASMLHKERFKTGLRPFDPAWDLGVVAELIGVAFGDSLDPAGQAALADMRRIARWGAILGWLYSPGWSSLGSTPGFVWVEDGHVVGNVSLRRALQWGGFLIGNVAVHPDWQGRGIAGNLIEKALKEISSQGGRWAGLEVESGNQVARRLYAAVGFEEIGRVLHMLRPAGLPWNGNSSLHPALRCGRSRDGAALVDLVQAVIPDHQRPLLELRLKDYQPNWERTLDHFFEGRRETWWVIEEGDQVRAAVRSVRERGKHPDRLEVLISPDSVGRFEDVLVRRAVSGLQGGSRKPIEVLLPNATDSLVAALGAADFQKLRVLVQMRLDLSF
jgi:ribosomal protein S18 acetylase RimI-like enzyme